MIFPPVLGTSNFGWLAKRDFWLPSTVTLGVLRPGPPMENGRFQAAFGKLLWVGLGLNRGNLAVLLYRICRNCVANII